MHDESWMFQICSSCSDHSQIIELFEFVDPVRQIFRWENNDSENARDIKIINRLTRAITVTMKIFYLLNEKMRRIFNFSKTDANAQNQFSCHRLRMRAADNTWWWWIKNSTSYNRRVEFIIIVSIHPHSILRCLSIEGWFDLLEHRGFADYLVLLQTALIHAKTSSVNRLRKSFTNQRSQFSMSNLRLLWSSCRPLISFFFLLLSSSAHQYKQIETNELWCCYFIFYVSFRLFPHWIPAQHRLAWLQRRVYELGRVGSVSSAEGTS